LREVSTASAERRAGILDLLATTGFVDVADLARRFACSPATTRRDLAALEAAGYLHRTHGGAIANGQRELPVGARLETMAAAKQRIAEAAVAMVQDGQAVGLTGGSTTQQIARRLAGRSGLTVVTNALNVAMELAQSDVRLVVTGGEMRAQSMELVGPLAEPTTTLLHLDVTFAGVDGLSVPGGLTTHHPLEAQVNRVLIERSSRSVVVTDHTKLGRATFAQIVPLAAVSDVITDADAPADVVAELQQAGVNVLRA
jgi:DeoR family transcriptional regulator, aga operon transcriptional repressor